MAANMQQMAAGQMMGQHPAQRRFASQEISNVVTQTLMTQQPIMAGWQAGVQITDRLGKIMNL